MKKKIFIITLILVVLLSGNILISFAANKSDLQQQNESLGDKIDQAKNDLNNVNSNLTGIMAEIQKLTAQISEYQDEIDDLDSQISSLESQITEQEGKLKQAEEDYEKQRKNLEGRIVAIYEAGETTYLDVLLSSASITDFISNYYVVEELAEYDNNLLDSIEKNKKSIEEAKKVLEDSKTQIETLKTSKVAKANALKDSQSVKQQYANELTADQKELQAQLDEFEAEKKRIQEELRRIAEEEKNSGGKIDNGPPSSFGYIFPVQGLSLSNINNKSYPSYYGHTGVDVNINVVGKNVVAVKSGTVVISKSTWGSIPNYGTDGTYKGSYSSYGEYIIINHHDGTMTLYAHMLPGSRTVQAGQTVSQGQVIGKVGNTGNCLPRPSASNPLNGTHLHFEVRVNGKCVNPLPYLGY